MEMGMTVSLSYGISKWHWLELVTFQKLKESIRLRMRNGSNRESCWGDRVFQE